MAAGFTAASHRSWSIIGRRIIIFDHFFAILIG